MEVQNDITVYLVDDNDEFLKTLESSLNESFKSEVKFQSFITGEDCLKKIEETEKKDVDAVVLGYHLNTVAKNAMDGIRVLQKIKELNPKIIVIMLSSEDKRQIAIDSIKSGAYEYIIKNDNALINVQQILRKSLEKSFNSKITKLTLLIKEKYPELYQHVGEMTETISDEKDHGVTLKNLKTYYYALDAMLKKYLLEHPEKAVSKQAPVS